MARTPMLRQIRRLISAALQANRLHLTEASVRERLEEDHHTLINRRRFLEGAAVTAAVAASGASLFGGEAAAASSSAASLLSATPVVVVGAGAAGMAAAYTLKKSRIPFVLRIPTQTSRRLRSIPAGDSNGSQPVIPTHSSHP